MKTKKKVFMTLLTLLLMFGIITCSNITKKEDFIISNSIYNSYNKGKVITNEIEDKKVTTDNVEPTEEQEPNKEEVVSTQKDLTIKKETSQEVKQSVTPKTKEETPVSTPSPKVEEKPVTKTNDNVIENVNGKMTGYGHDCYGCTSGHTSSGLDISDGHIYYSDKTYGDVRIVAGDKKYPFGTIVKISNFMNNSPFYAIVLDRGSGIGLDRNAQFDLLYPSNSDAWGVGIQNNVLFEIIRLGY